MGSLRCPCGFPWQPVFFDRCSFWASKFLNNFIRPMTRLFVQRPPTIWTPTEGMRLLASRGP